VFVDVNVLLETDEEEEDDEEDDDDNAAAAADHCEMMYATVDRSDVDDAAVFRLVGVVKDCTQFCQEVRDQSSPAR